MSYGVRDFVEARRRNHNTICRDFNRTLDGWQPEEPAWIPRGPHPNLKPVFRRHPDWRRRLKKLLRERR